MSKFLLVSARTGKEILDSEYRDFLTTTGLEQSRLDHVVLDASDSRIGDISSYAGVFLGGSPFNVTDPDYPPEQAHIQEELLSLADTGVPTMYVCFGSSLLTHGLGGEVGRKWAEPAGQTLVQLTDAGKADPLLRGIPEEFVSLTGHTECVAKLPPTATLLATGPTCPVQMFRTSPTTWACQFHAEMGPEALIVRMKFYLDHGYFDPADFDAIVAEISELDTSDANRILRNFVEMFD